jgi:hypothetical protein
LFLPEQIKDIIIFGACRLEYAQKPGVLFDEKFQGFVTTVKESLATSPT